MIRKLLYSILLCLYLLSSASLAASAHKEVPEPPLNQVSCNNQHPIILVHGFMGFGREMSDDFFYWGGTTDLQKELIQAGFDVRTASIGPVSSNWDRACELYAVIKGGQVDYGQAHSEKFGHERYGRTFQGLYPEWGEVNPETGTINKIHIISHSMGGQTARMLAQLLTERTPYENPVTAGTNDLFTGGKSWICSITTISSPHDGTSLTRAVNRNPQLIRNMLVYLASLNQITMDINLFNMWADWKETKDRGSFYNFYILQKEKLKSIQVDIEEQIFDMKLDQWNLYRFKGESQKKYRERIWDAPIWEDTRDISSWDLSPEGASEMNGWVKASEDIYYFSWANEESINYLEESWYLPELGMNPFLLAPTLFLGVYIDSESTIMEGELILVDQDWWENDGVVNTNSMDGPTLNSTDKIKIFSGAPEKGCWNFMGKQPSLDHGNLIGILTPPSESPPGYSTLVDWYIDQCQLLWSLPE